jgi:hypothetical protein
MVLEVYSKSSGKFHFDLYQSNITSTLDEAEMICPWKSI